MKEYALPLCVVCVSRRENSHSRTHTHTHTHTHTPKAPEKVEGYSQLSMQLLYLAHDADAFANVHYPHLFAAAIFPKLQLCFSAANDDNDSIVATVHEVAPDCANPLLVLTLRLCNRCEM